MYCLILQIRTMKKTVVIISLLFLAFLASEARTVTGKVISGKKKLSGVVVTDGKNFTQTRRNGTFSFEICDSADFVYIVTPSGYTADWSDGSPAFYRKAEGQSHFEFDLKFTGKPTDTYNIIAVGDPQPRSVDHFNEFAGTPLDDIRQCAASMTDPTVAIVLGDICHDKYYLMQNWKDTMKSEAIPFYPVIGNHDHNRKFPGDDKASVSYEEAFGPANYAFFIGDDVVIVLDNIIYHSRSGYELGFTEQILNWVRGLMKFVPAEADVYVAQHASLNGRHYRGMIINHDVLLDILQGHKVTIMSGHNHTSGVFEYAPDVMEHNIAAICGTWWDVYHCTDGTPRGYKVFTKKKGELEWYYKSISRDRDFQYEIYMPGQAPLNPGCVVVNVWDYDPKWSLEWYEDGKPMGSLTQVEELSPLHAESIRVKYEQLGKEPADYRLTREAKHYFAAKPSAGAKTIQIVIKDRFGKEWTEEIKLNNIN